MKEVNFWKSTSGKTATKAKDTFKVIPAAIGAVIGVAMIGVAIGAVRGAFN